MTHWRAVKQSVTGRDCVDLGSVGMARPMQGPVCQHGTLWPPPWFRDV